MWVAENLARPFEEPAQTSRPWVKFPSAVRTALADATASRACCLELFFFKSVDAGAVSFHHGLPEDARGTLASELAEGARRAGVKPANCANTIGHDAASPISDRYL
jgi:hypothetical protein